MNNAEEYYNDPQAEQQKQGVAYFLSIMYGKLSRLANAAEEDNKDENGAKLRGRRLEFLQKSADYADVFADTAAGKNIKVAVYAYNELGVALRSKGDKEKSVEYLEKAATVARKSDNFFERAAPLLNLASFCREDKDFSGDEKYLVRAIPLLEKHYEKTGDVNDGQIYAGVLQDYALSRRLSGEDLASLDSIRAQKKAVELFSFAEENQVKTAAAYVLLARLYAGMNNNKRGLETAEKARAVLGEKLAIIESRRGTPDKNLTDYIAETDALIAELKAAYESKKD